MVSDCATSAFRGSPDRSQAYVLGGESPEQKRGPVSSPVKEKGPEVVADCNGRKRPNQVIFFIFWWGVCERGGCLRNGPLP